jgi:tetratricopeptide (TPR) repeat protein
VAAADDALRAGRSHLSRGELDLAIRAFRAALRDGPEDLDAREALGLALAKAGQNEDALLELELVCARAPSRESARRARGEVLMRLGRFEQGVDELKRAMDSGRNRREGP